MSVRVSKRMLYLARRWLEVGDVARIIASRQLLLQAGPKRSRDELVYDEFVAPIVMKYEERGPFRPYSTSIWSTCTRRHGQNAVREFLRRMRPRSALRRTLYNAALEAAGVNVVRPA
jgi:hypothetical protein